MKIKVDDNNFVVINLERGGRIVELVLGGHLIIQGNASDTGSGNYLLYPWVNRIEQSPFKHQKSPYQDANQLPIHGFYVDEPRQAEISLTGEGFVAIKLTPQLKIEDVPLFSETYTLSKGKLSLQFVVYHGIELLPFCFGYHPYLQIDDQPITNLKLSTDIKTDLKLNHRLLPFYPFQRKQVVITATDKLDNLFEGGSFLQIETQAGFAVRIKSDLPYWQIYTPPDGRRIAVEPMSFIGNVYKISQSGFKPTLHTGHFQIKAWQN